MQESKELIDRIMNELEQRKDRNRLQFRELTSSITTQHLDVVDLIQQL